MLEDVDEDEIGRVGADGVDDGEREFSLREVFAEAFVVGVGCVGEVAVVVEDLEEEADGVDEGDVVGLGLREGWVMMVV